MALQQEHIIWSRADWVRTSKGVRSPAPEQACCSLANGLPQNASLNRSTHTLIDQQQSCRCRRSSFVSQQTSLSAAPRVWRLMVFRKDCGVLPFARGGLGSSKQRVPLGKGLAGAYLTQEPRRRHPLPARTPYIGQPLGAARLPEALTGAAPPARHQYQPLCRH